MKRLKFQFQKSSILMLYIIIYIKSENATDNIKFFEFSKHLRTRWRINSIEPKFRGFAVMIIVKVLISVSETLTKYMARVGSKS